MKNYSKNNFHKHTFCLWQEVPFSEIERLEKNHQSKSGSGYVFVDNGVYRISNHWGRVANCRWRLLPLENYKNQQIKVGFATWNDFYPNDESSKLFFIKVYFATNEVTFFHKLSPEYDGKNTLRSVIQTSKTIKIIKEILTETTWSKYLQFDDLNVLRKEIIEKLLTSDKSYFDIKKEYI